MLGHGGLRDAEFLPDDLGDRAGRLFPGGEELQNPASHRIAEYVECVHVGHYGSSHLYKQGVR